MGTAIGAGTASGDLGGDFGVPAGGDFGVAAGGDLGVVGGRFGAGGPLGAWAPFALGAFLLV